MSLGDLHCVIMELVFPVQFDHCPENFYLNIFVIEKMLCMKRKEEKKSLLQM